MRLFCVLAVIISSSLATAAEWVTLAPMSSTRNGEQIIRLQDGRILAGGTSFGGACEIFDPATGVWTATDSTAGPGPLTLLNDGKVLNSGVGQRFDPVTGLWSAAGGASGPVNHAAVKLNDGRVLLVGGGSESSRVATCAIYDPVTNTTAAAGSLNTARYSPGCILLSNGKVLAVSGGSTGADASCEIYDPGADSWTNAAGLNEGRYAAMGGIQLIALPGGKILIAGGWVLNDSGPSAKCEIYNPGDDTWTNTGSMSKVRLAHTVSLLPGGRVLAAGGAFAAGVAEIFDPATGTWTTTVAESVQRFFNGATSAGDGSVFVLGGRIYDGVNATNTTFVDMFTLNSRPTLSIATSQRTILPGESVSFTSTTGDPDGDAVGVTWDFADGATTTEANPVHTFTAAGTYVVSAVAKDVPAAQPPFKTTATVTIIVADGRPVPRFTTSDVVGFVGLPLTFDASRSTDAQNGITAYSWNFGDGTPAGAGQVISKIFNATGSYDVTLTITDADGFTPSLTRRIEILPADQAGLFTGFVTYKVRWDRDHENKDTLSVAARVNIGEADASVGNGTAVAVEIVGQRFTATLDKRQRAKSSTATWTVAANTRKQEPGQVDIKVTIKKASLGAAFNAAGITGTKAALVDADVPLQVEIAGRIFSVLADSSFKFSGDGKKASGDGEGP